MRMFYRFVGLAMILTSSVVIANDNQVISGHLISVNLAKSELVIEDKEHQQSVIKVARSTRIFHDDQKITLITLCPKQRLSVSIDSSIPAADRINLLGERKFPPNFLYPTNDLVTVIPGTLPLIISAPHGGREMIPGVPKRKDDTIPKFVITMDSNTYELARSITKNIEQKLGGRPWFIGAKFHRSYLDVNRSVEHGLEHKNAREVYIAYHQALQHAISQVACHYQTGLLIDVHGQSRLPDVVWRGTRKGTTMGGLVDQFGWEPIEGKLSLMHSFEELGYPIHPKGIDASEAPFTGGFITGTYGYPYGLNAIQLEYGYSFRASKEIYLKTARDTANAILKFHTRYLLKKFNCLADVENREQSDMSK